MGSPTPTGGSPAQLIMGSRYMTLARYPNAGEWLRIAAIPEGAGGEARIETPYAAHWGRFACEDDRPRQWKDADDLDLTQSGALQLESTISHRFPAGRMGEAYELAHGHSKELIAAAFDWREVGDYTLRCSTEPGGG